MYNVIVIGGGIVGLASALKIKEQNPTYRVAVLEKEKSIALHQTGHNSGVIHSGLYYKPGSFKAKNCVKGHKMLIDFCKQEGVKYERTGKVVVATADHQLPQLDMLMEYGKANGLKGLKRLNKEQLKRV